MIYTQTQWFSGSGHRLILAGLARSCIYAHPWEFGGVDSYIYSSFLGQSSHEIYVPDELILKSIGPRVMSCNNFPFL